MDRSECVVLATNKRKWIAFIMLSLLLILIALFWREETLAYRYRVKLIFASSILLGYATGHTIYSATMNNCGVSCFYFGKMMHSVLWDQVEEVVVIRDYRINLRSSGNKRIVIIPKECPSYDPKKWFGVQYVYQFRKQVIWIDYTDVNRQFIEKRYGTIIDRS